MSHTTETRPLLGTSLAIVHNGDHSGPTRLMVMKAKGIGHPDRLGDSDVDGEVEIPNGELLVMLAVKVLIPVLQSLKDRKANLGSKVALGTAVTVLESLVDDVLPPF